MISFFFRRITDGIKQKVRKNFVHHHRIHICIQMFWNLHLQFQFFIFYQFSHISNLQAELFCYIGLLCNKFVILDS